MTDEDRVLLNLALATGMASRAVWTALLTVASTAGEKERGLILLALGAAETQVGIAIATAGVSRLQGPFEQAREQIRDFRLKLQRGDTPPDTAPPATGDGAG